MALSTAVLSGSNALRMAVQLAILPVLARLLGPADYGLVALAMPIVLFANTLADAGLGGALARRLNVTAEVESSVFWLAGALGLGLSLLTSLLAWPIAYLIGEPRLALLLIALSPIMTLCALASAANARIIRERRFGVFAASDIVSTLVSTAVALFLALRGAGAWSLVAQQVVLWACKFAWIFAASRLTIRFHCRPSEVRDLLRFGRDVTGANVADFASRNVDNLIIGAVAGAAALGQYALAYQLIRAPDMIISGPLYLFIFTAVVRAVQAGGSDAVQEITLASVRLGAVLMAPLFCGLALVADLLADALLGPKWTGVIVPLRFLAAAGFCFGMCSIITTTLRGLGDSALQLRLTVIMAVGTIVAVAATAWLGLPAVSAALAAVMAATVLLYIHRLAAAVGTSPLRFYAAFGPACLASLSLTAVVMAARATLGGLPIPAQLLLSIVIGGLGYVGALWISKRKLMADVRTFANAQSDQQAG